MSTSIFGQGGTGSGGGGGSNASVGSTGVTAPTSATELGIINISGNLVGVSASNPIPISGSITASNAAVGATGSAVPASASYDGINVAGTMRGATGVNPSGSIYATQMDLTSLNGVSLGSPTNFGTTPTAVAVPGVNASLFIGTTVATAAAAGIQKVGVSGATGVTLDAVLGAAVPANALLVAGSDGTDLRALTTDATGHLIVEPGNTANTTAWLVTATAFGTTGSAVPAGASVNGLNIGGTLRGQTGVNVTGSVYAAQCDLTSLNGVGLGSPSNFGTTPGAVEVQGVNASLFIGTVAAVAAASGVQKVGISGNAGAAVDAAQGAAAPANVLAVGGVYNTSLPSLSTTDISAFQIDAKGQIFTDFNYVLGALHSKTNPVFTAITDGTNVITAAISAYGTAPTGTEVMGVNAFVTGSKTYMTGTVPGTAPAQTEVIGGIYNSSAPTPSTGQTLPIQLDASGNLLVNLKAGAAGNTAASATGSAVPANADYTGYNSGGNLVGVSTANPLPVGPTVSGTLTDRSGTVTTGGTTQVLAASNASRKYIFIENPVSATEVLYINFTTAASTTAKNSIELSPGGSYERTLATYMSTEAINVTAVTSAHPFIAKEG